MGDLQVGRAGIATDLANPFRIGERPGGRANRTVQINGHVKDTTTLAQALDLRDALMSQTDQLIALTSTVDPSIDGFYILRNASIELNASLGSLQSTGFFPYSLDLERVNTVHFNSGLTGRVLPNDHSITSGEPFVCPPGSSYAFTPDLSFYTRTGADGALTIFHPVDQTYAPVWSVDPANYYLGAVTLYVGGVVVAGDNIRRNLVDTTDWSVDNSIFIVKAGTAGFTIQLYNTAGSLESQVGFEVTEGGTAIGAWDDISVLRNDPEEVSVRLMQDRSSIRGRRVLDLTVRRGSRFAHGFYSTSASTTIGVRRTASDAASSFGAAGIRDSANDGNGNRWVLGTLHTHSETLTGQSGIFRSSATAMDFFVGHEYDGSGAVAGDTAADLTDQYIHYLAERVVPMQPAGIVAL